MNLMRKKNFTIIFVFLLMMGCDLADEKAKAKDTNITKEDAVELTAAYNEVVSVNSGESDVSDFYKIGLRSGDIVQYSGSDNVNLKLEGNFTNLDSDKIQMDQHGTLYIEVEFLDANNGSLKLKAYDPVLTTALKSDFTTQHSGGSTISWSADANGYMVVETDMSSDPLDYPHAKIGRAIKSPDLTGTIVDMSNFRSLVIEYKSTHELRLTLKDNYAEQTGFSYDPDLKKRSHS